MRRRTFLHAASAPIGLAALDRVNRLRVPAPSAQGAAVHTASRSSVVVIGAGAFGGWTALHLREMGHDVTLVDAYGPGNSRATSGDETRQIRCGYGDRLLYARSALRAMTAWREREQQFGVALLNPTGRLQLAPAWSPSLKATQATLSTLGVPFETMTDGDLRKRYPQMNPDGMGVGLLEPGAMVIRAKQAMLAVSQAFVRAGGTLRVARVQPGTVEGGRMVDLRVDDGSRLAADAFVFACGPWLPKLFPGLLGSRIQVPGRDVLYFGLPAGDLRLAFPNFPNYSEERYYGFASIDGRGFKVCPTSGTTSFDPDVDERIISATEVRRARAYLAQRFPSLANQPITESRVCQLENTTDEHFIIDRHPEMGNVLLAGGGSGHGFKHGPVIGQYIAKRALGEPTDADFDHMVRLAR